MLESQHSITLRKRVKADRHRVFDAFAQPDALAQWFRPSLDISINILSFNFEQGGHYRFQYTMPDGSQPVLSGVYQKINQPKDITFTWMWESPDPHANINTLVKLTLLEKNEWTELIIVHENLKSEDMATRHKAGWNATLDMLELSLN